MNIHRFAALTTMVALFLQMTSAQIHLPSVPSCNLDSVCEAQNVTAPCCCDMSFAFTNVFGGATTTTGRECLRKDMCTAQHWINALRASGNTNIVIHKAKCETDIDIGNPHPGNGGDDDGSNGDDNAAARVHGTSHPLAFMTAIVVALASALI